MIAFLSGLLAGSLHVISGPDHVAAVAPLALRTPHSGRSLGALWGVGHGGGVLLWLGLTSTFQYAFGRALPSEALEALVGVALVALGVASFWHRHGEQHSHHVTHGHRWPAFAMGALHGSAGASHLLALLPTLGLPGNGALTYASGYLFAGIIAMASVGTLMGRYAVRIANPLRIQRLCALSVVALGLFWLFTSVRELA